MLSRVKRRVTDYFCDFLSSLDSWGVDQVQFSLQRWWTGLEVPAHEIADAKSHYRRSDVNTEKFISKPQRRKLLALARRGGALAVDTAAPCVPQWKRSEADSQSPNRCRRTRRAVAKDARNR